MVGSNRLTKNNTLQRERECHVCAGYGGALNIAALNGEIHQSILVFHFNWNMIGWWVSVVEA